MTDKPEDNPPAGSALLYPDYEQGCAVLRLQQGQAFIEIHLSPAQCRAMALKLFKVSIRVEMGVEHGGKFDA